MGGAWSWLDFVITFCSLCAKTRALFRVLCLGVSVSLLGLCENVGNGATTGFTGHSYHGVLVLLDCQYDSSYSSWSFHLLVLFCVWWCCFMGYPVGVWTTVMKGHPGHVSYHVYSFSVYFTGSLVEFIMTGCFGHTFYRLWYFLHVSFDVF